MTKEKLMPPSDCDICSNNFLSHTIHYCPDCGLCYCDTCWDTQHHCYDDEEAEAEAAWDNEWADEAAAQQEIISNQEGE